MDKISLWQKQLKVILNISNRIFSDRLIFNSYFDIVKNNDSIQNPRHFHLFVARGFFVNYLITIRKLMDGDKNSISLHNFLKDVHKNNRLINQNWFASTFRYGNAKTDFLKFSGGKIVLSKREISKDITTLKRLSKKSGKYVNKIIAHTDNKISKRFKPPKIEELTEFYESLEKIVKKYYFFLKGSSLNSVTPVIQENWTTIFTIPWIIKN